MNPIERPPVRARIRAAGQDTARDHAAAGTADFDD
jgi:hypothetical protein